MDYPTNDSGRYEVKASSNQMIYISFDNSESGLSVTTDNPGSPLEVMIISRAKSALEVVNASRRAAKYLNPFEYDPDPLLSLIEGYCRLEGYELVSIPAPVELPPGAVF